MFPRNMFVLSLWTMGMITDQTWWKKYFEHETRPIWDIVQMYTSADIALSLLQVANTPVGTRTSIEHHFDMNERYQKDHPRWNHLWCQLMDIKLIPNWGTIMNIILISFIDIQKTINQGWDFSCVFFSSHFDVLFWTVKIRMSDGLDASLTLDWHHFD